MTLRYLPMTDWRVRLLRWIVGFVNTPLIWLRVPFRIALEIGDETDAPFDIRSGQNMLVNLHLVRWKPERRRDYLWSLWPINRDPFQFPRLRP